MLCSETGSADHRSCTGFGILCFDAKGLAGTAKELLNRSVLHAAAVSVRLPSRTRLESSRTVLKRGQGAKLGRYMSRRPPLRARCKTA